MPNPFNQIDLSEEILKNITDIINEISLDYKKEIENASDDEMKKELELSQKPILLSYQRIKNNAVVQLLRSGCVFKLDASDLKSSKLCILETKYGNYKIEIQDIKSLLGSDATEILSKGIINKNNQKNKEFNKNKMSVNKNILNKSKNQPKVENLQKPMKQIKVDVPDIDVFEFGEEATIKTNTETRKIKEDKNIKVENVLQFNKETTNEKVDIMPSLKEVKQETKEEKEIKIEIPKENKHESEITSRLGFENDDFEMFKEDITIYEKEEKQSFDESHDVEIDDLIMDIYNVKFTDKENGSNQVFTVIIAPEKMSSDEKGSPIPSYCFVRSGRHICTGASYNNKRLSYNVTINDESFIIRGRWNEEGFSSILYPQNLKGKNIVVEKTSIHPETYKNIGHSVIKYNEDIQFHVLPLASKNADNGYVGVLVCLENMKDGEKIAVCSKDKPYAEIKYQDINYVISSSWENQKLKTKIN